MRYVATTLFIGVVFLLIPAHKAKAQAFEDAGQYMGYIADANEKLSAVYLSYMSAVAHKNARKQEKRRQDVVSAIFNTREKIMGMPPWKGDRSYKDTSVAYLKILNTVFNEDYAKIVNMEEIAEQSYDAMEAYMLAEEKAWAKLADAGERQSRVSKEFAERHNVKLINVETEVGRKSKVAGDLNKHYNEVYLIFFRPYKQEMYLLDALEKGNVIAIEQNINSLEKFAKEGLEKLKKLKGFNNDPSLIEACREAIVFYADAASQSKSLSDFFLKKENFDKVQKKFESKRKNDRTQADIDEYNKAVNDMNAGVKDYNNVNQKLNKDRAAMLNNWNKKAARYMDDHMPVQKKQS